MISDLKHIFIYLLVIYMSSLEKYLFRVLCPFFIWVICVFAIELYEFLVYFGYYPFIGYVIYKYFLPFCRLSLHFVDCSLCCTELFNVM